MAYYPTKTRTWDTDTDDYGSYYEAEFDQLYANWTNFFGTGGTQLSVDEINEQTENNGVYIDGVCFKGGGVAVDWFYPIQVGNDLNLSGVTFPSIAGMSGNEIALIDAGLGTLGHYTWDGSDWTLDDDELTISCTMPSICVLSSTEIAFIDSTNNELRHYTWDGTEWIEDGQLSLTVGGTSALAALSSTDVALVNATAATLTRYSWSDSAWSQYGSALTIDANSYPSITALNGTDVAYIDSTNDELRLYRWDDDTSTWSEVGTALSITCSYPSITALNGIDVAFIDATNAAFRVYRWSDITETFTLMDGSEISVSSVTIPALAAISGTDVAYIDTTNDDLRVYRFGQSITDPPPSCGASVGA